MKRKKGYLDNEIIIRSLSKSDIDVIAGDLCLPWSTVQESKEKWNNYYREQQTGIRTVGIVEQVGEKKMTGPNPNSLHPIKDYDKLVFFSKNLLF